jgi:hypothetical protein
MIIYDKCPQCERHKCVTSTCCKYCYAERNRKKRLARRKKNEEIALKRRALKKVMNYRFTKSL